VDGKHADFNSPADARNAGIETSYQDLALVNLMTISRNFFLEGKNYGNIKVFNMNKRKQKSKFG
jgi:ABC-type sugar transport system ATPase subunit